MMKMIRFFTVVFIYLALSSANAHASNDIVVTKPCLYSKLNKQYVLAFRAPINSSAWYKSNLKFYSLHFTNQTDCDLELDKLVRPANIQNTFICGCYPSAKLDPLFMGGKFWGFSRVTCMKFDKLTKHNYVIQDKKIIRNGWLDLDYEDQYKADLTDYFDMSDSEGPNYELCKSQIPSLIKSL